jgi:AP-4 complex subunit mu-1
LIRPTVRGDVPKDTAAIFFRHVKFWNGEKRDAPPIFWLNGVSYLYIKQSGLYFMCTSKANVSPSLYTEFLARCSKVFKDYLGVLSEESIRKNFVLCYELLDEMMVLVRFFQL